MRVTIKLPCGRIRKVPKESLETATVKAEENAMKPRPEPKHIGGGWYNVGGKKVQGKERAEEEARRPFVQES